ncbi:hypothetical protein JCM17823_20140 [Halorubrum gandharaense]
MAERGSDTTFGVLTSDPSAVDRIAPDLAYVFADEVSGDSRDPGPDAVASVACWGDTGLVERDPDRAAVDADGIPATPDHDRLQWGVVCPTDEAYRGGLLDRIAELGSADAETTAGDVRLTTVGFPGASFCHCDRCDRRFAASDHEDRNAWRVETLTEFVADAADRVDGDLSVTLYPDPYPGNLQERTGLEPEALAPHVDGFHVPLCGPGYETIYWVESLARGFAGRTAKLDAELTIQLSAADTSEDRLVEVAELAAAHADHVVFGTYPADETRIGRVLDRLRERPDASPS